MRAATRIVRRAPDNTPTSQSSKSYLGPLKMDLKNAWSGRLLYVLRLLREPVTPGSCWVGLSTVRRAGRARGPET